MPEGTLPNTALETQIADKNGTDGTYAPTV